MARPVRIKYKDATYHVMNRGLAHKPVFRSDEDYREFLKILEEAYRHWRIRVLAYALMPNHYHVCLQTPEGNISIKGSSPD